VAQAESSSTEADNLTASQRDEDRCRMITNRIGGVLNLGSEFPGELRLTFDLLGLL
jgi:hypothetical protein